MSKIIVEDLNFYYGDVQALKDVNMTIEPNEITALIGPSGCGKSTFLRAFNRMNDFIKNTSVDGSIIYDGMNIVDKDIDVVELRMKVGMVFQKPNPLPKSIFENVIYGPKRHGLKKKHLQKELVESSLKQAALWEEVKEDLNKSGFELSGGQQQRLCIARCLSMKPDILLFDEPTSALDPISTMKIEDLLVQLKEHYTIIIVTHSMHQAARISDKTAFFLNGEVIEMGETGEIFSNAKDNRTERYISGKFG
ncbi:MAG: phosphate ABC transporter ATP-binding protein [Firmicutes bacterium HGW-Firmicutes-2]|jgi:phosphate transport system ATP-binding protein|nr:MAG: phosphate ABC transporter ATP-binding protein [Firmicutes bacterium HGW-Firmicutes-2]